MRLRDWLSSQKGTITVRHRVLAALALIFDSRMVFFAKGGMLPSRRLGVYMRGAYRRRVEGMPNECLSLNCFTRRLGEVGFQASSALWALAGGALSAPWATVRPRRTLHGFATGTRSLTSRFLWCFRGYSFGVMWCAWRFASCLLRRTGWLAFIVARGLSSFWCLP